MKTYATGLVVGKFWPPHMGHSYLIHQANARCINLTVLVIYRPDEAPSGFARLSALRTLHPSVKFEMHLSPGDEYDDDSVYWAKYVKDRGFEPDVVFTSENYGEPWAQALGCDHVCVDLERTKVPISATEIRENPYKNWAHLNPYIKPYYGVKICVVGGESTGKSTLVPTLAGIFNASYTIEAGRDWVETYGADPNDEGIWSYILDEQPERERLETIASPNGLVICDTDLLTTSVWWLAWHNKINDFWIYVLNNVALAHAQSYTHYLIMSHNGVPWIDDGTRSEEHRREFFTNGILNAVEGAGVPFTVIEGDFNQRTDKAIEVVSRLAKELKIPT